jgi:hypothetical protein
MRALTPKERLTLVLKHRDARPQREIARLLAVGEPRVSRLLAAAVARLRDAMARLGSAPEGAPGRPVADGALEEPLAARLAAAVAEQVAILGPAPAPSRAEGTRRSGP